MAVKFSHLDSQTLLEYHNTVVTKEYILLLLKNGKKINDLYTLKSANLISTPGDTLRQIYEAKPLRGEQVVL